MTPDRPVDLVLRGHHFLCTLHYQGAGYSTAFTDTMTDIVTGIRDRGSSVVEVAPQADGICAACPSLQPDGQACAFQASVLRRDAALLEAMGWRPGDRLALEPAYEAVIARRDELMDVVCTGCEWRPRCDQQGPYGIASPLARP